MVGIVVDEAQDTGAPAFTFLILLVPECDYRGMGHQRIIATRSSVVSVVAGVCGRRSKN